MRMTTKLVSLLTILFVFFKFGEPAIVMMSIYGDKGFLFHSNDLTTANVVGFVYDKTNGAFTVTNCTDLATPTGSNFTLEDDCTVVPTSDVTVSPSDVSQVAETEETALRAEAAPEFPATGVNTNFMVAKLETSGPIVIKTVADLTSTATTLITITAVVGTAGTAAADAANSIILCNDSNEEDTKNFLTVSTDSSALGQVKHVAGAAYRPIMKCVAAVRNAALDTATISAFATFILIVRDHADLKSSLSLLAFPSVVLLPQSINQTPNDTTVVGYINGIDKCPTNGSVAFASTAATPCKGTISIGTSGNYSFSYNGTTYHLPVTNASGATTSTTTCEDFVFNIKYSNTLIGMLLIFMLKMSQTY